MVATRAPTPRQRGYTKYLITDMYDKACRAEAEDAVKWGGWTRRARKFGYGVKKRSQAGGRRAETRFTPRTSRARRQPGGLENERLRLRV